MNVRISAVTAFFKREEIWLIPMGILLIANFWPVLNFYNENIIEWPTISFKGNVEIIIFAIACFILSSIATLFFTKKNVENRARIFNTLSLLTIFSFYIIPFLIWVKSSSTGTIIFENIQFGIGLISFFLMVVFAIIFWFFSAKRGFRNIVSLMVGTITFVALIQLFYSVTVYVGQKVSQLEDQIDIGQRVWQDEYIESLEPSSEPENVYYIILDGYSSSSVLNGLGFDNSPFIKKMNSFGFEELNKGWTNYTSTHLALKAILDMEYPVTGKGTQYSYNNVYPRDINSGLKPLSYRAFDKMGYKIKRYGNHYATCKGSQNCYDGTQESILSPDNALLTFLRNHFIFKVFNKFWPIPLHDSALIQLQYEVKDNNIQTPSFVFLHSYAPHPPSRFKENCQPDQTKNATSAWNWLKGEEPFYFQAISCTNKVTINLIEKIQSNDPTAIIIVQSDHGSDFYTDYDLESEEWSKETMREKGSFLNLIKAPEVCKKWLYPEISQINTMRFVVGCLQKQKPQYLEDKSFIARNSKIPNIGTVYEYDFLKNK
jgi:hypothetical protein